jgi:hypothetical protein
MSTLFARGGPPLFLDDSPLFSGPSILMASFLVETSR